MKIDVREGNLELVSSLELDPEAKVQIGNLYHNSESDSIYVLAMVNLDENKINLINLSNGMPWRFNGGVTIQNDYVELEDFNNLIGKNSFGYVGKVS
jgi:hypothetical protein